VLAYSIKENMKKVIGIIIIYVSRYYFQLYFTDFKFKFNVDACKDS